MTTIKAKDQDLGSFPGMLWELRLYPVGTGWPGNAFYFRSLATLSRIGFEAGKNKGSFKAIVLIHFRCDQNYELVIF